MFLLRELFGPLDPQEDTWKLAMTVVLEQGSAWDGEQGGMARVLLGWVGEEVEARDALLQSVMEVWGRADSIKNSGESNRICESLRGRECASR